MTRLRSTAERLWTALKHPTPEPLGSQVLRLTVVLLLCQVASLVLAMVTEYSFESWLMNLSVSTGVVGASITGYGLLQISRWLMRQS